MKKSQNCYVNKSHKFESGFLGVKIIENNSVMLGNMSGIRTWNMGGSW